MHASTSIKSTRPTNDTEFWISCSQQHHYESSICCNIPTDRRRWPNVGLVMGRRSRRWPIIKPTLAQLFLCSTNHVYNICTTSAQRLRRWTSIVQIWWYTNIFCLLGIHNMHEYEHGKKHTNNIRGIFAVFLFVFLFVNICERKLRSHIYKYKRGNPSYNIFRQVGLDVWK